MKLIFSAFLLVAGFLTGFNQVLNYSLNEPVEGSMIFVATALCVLGLLGLVTGLSNKAHQLRQDELNR